MGRARNDTINVYNTYLIPKPICKNNINLQSQRNKSMDVPMIIGK